MDSGSVFNCPLPLKSVKRSSLGRLKQICGILEANGNPSSGIFLRGMYAKKLEHWDVEYESLRLRQRHTRIYTMYSGTQRFHAEVKKTCTQSYSVCSIILETLTCTLLPDHQDWQVTHVGWKDGLFRKPWPCISWERLRTCSLYPR